MTSLTHPGTNPSISDWLELRHTGIKSDSAMWLEGCISPIVPLSCFSCYVLTVLRRVPLISHVHFQYVLHNHKSKGHRVINHPLKSLKQWPDKKILLFKTPRGKAECCWQNHISRDTLQMWTTHSGRKHPIPSCQLEIKAKPSSCDKPFLSFPPSLCACVCMCVHMSVYDSLNNTALPSLKMSTYV